MSPVACQASIELVGTLYIGVETLLTSLHQGNFHPQANNGSGSISAISRSSCSRVGASSRRLAASSTFGKTWMSPGVLRKIPGRCSTHQTARSMSDCSVKGLYQVALV